MKTNILRTAITLLLTTLACVVWAQGDLAAFELKGKVASCRWVKQYVTETYTFNTAGRWTKYNGQPLSTAFTEVKRDAKGRVVSTSMEVDFSINVTGYKYNSAGKLSSVSFAGAEDDVKETFVYGSDGRILRGIENSTYTEMGADESQHFTISKSYAYLATDAKGNWTKRKVTAGKESWVETRTIKYYQ